MRVFQVSFEINKEKRLTDIPIFSSKADNEKLLNDLIEMRLEKRFGYTPSFKIEKEYSYDNNGSNNSNDQHGTWL